MTDFSDSLIFGRVNAIVPDFNNYRKGTKEKKKEKKKEYSKIMKEVAEKLENLSEDGHINYKI